MLHEQPQKLLLRLGMILAPALAGVLAWSYAHRDFSRAAQPARSAVVAAPARPVADALAVEPSPTPATRGPEAQAAAESVPAAPAVVPARTAPLVLRTDDPKAIRALAERGLAAYGAAANDALRAEGVRLVQTAALLGDGPARGRLARDYPRSPQVYSVVPARDAIRYTLDDYSAGNASASDRNQPLVALAVFFAEREQLATFAATVVEAIADDPRLQSPATLDALLGSLAHVRGSCRAIAGVVVAAHLPAVECPRSLKTSVLAHVRQAGRSGRPGREDDARRRGLEMLQQLGAR